MKVKNISQGVDFSHQLLSRRVERGDVVVDATMGNGRDTVFLARLVGETGQVIGFDIQKRAVEKTRSLLTEHNLLDRVKLIHDGHECMEKHINDNIKPAAFIYNLGYLPGGDKDIITRPETTITALEQSLKLLKEGGLVVIVIYVGHQGGEVEQKALLNYVRHLNDKTYNVLYYHFINQGSPPPEVLAIKKRKKE